MFAMCTNRILLFWLCCLPLFSQEEIAKVDLPVLAVSPQAPATDGYTINYNTVPIIEYIRFASKICKVNFIYEEADLAFTVTVVSDEPITQKNVMATLVQVLRIHGLELLEQENNLVIHKSPNVKQLATLVTEGGKEGNAPIVTRVFRIKNAKPDALAVVIKPMISSSAILEPLTETRQLILTDVTANVEKVAALIENLDSPHTLLEIKSFEAQNNNPEFLIELGSQIMNPIAQGNPFILVPQSLANAIFIVSTPELVDQAMAVFTSLDTPPKKEVLSERRLRGENVFVYKVVNRSGDDVLKGLLNIGANLQKSGVAEPDLISTVEGAKWLPDTNSIMIVGSKDSIDKTKEFLSALDVSAADGSFSEKSSFFVYKPQSRSADEVEKAILEMAKNLKGTKGGDASLIEAIESVKINPSTHTLIFSGEEKNFARIKEMLATIDLSNGKGKASTRNNFFIYQIQKANASELQNSLKNFAKTLDKTQAANKGLTDAINNMKYIPENNSLLFTGPDADLKQLETLVASFDAGGAFPASSQFYIYKPPYDQGDQIVNSLKEVTSNLKSDQLSDPAFLHALESMKWVKSTNSLIFTGDPESLKKVEKLIGTLDVGKSSGKPGYFIYKVQNTSGDVIEDDLDVFAKNLKASGVKDTRLFDVIAKVRYVKETNSLILSGDPNSIEEVKSLIAQYDYPRAAVGVKSSNFYMYKPLHLSASQIEKSLQEIGANLKKSNLADPNLLQSIETVKYVDSTNSLIFTGSPDTLLKIQTLIKDIDLPPAAHAPIQHVGKTTFLLYKLKNASGPQIVTSLKAMSNDLKKSPSDKDLVNALATIKYIKETNSLFFTGTEDSLTKVQGLLEKFDVTGLAAPAEVTAPTATNFFVYRPQSLAGPELEKILTDFSENLKISGLSDPDLFNAIASAKWTDKTQTLVFTGTPKALDQVKELLVEFDIPANSANKLHEPSIQAIDNVSFLVYKLQFHRGDEIQNALRQIAKDLITTNAPINKGLLNTINSIQWLEVTNSLLASGDQDTLTRMRELLKNLDIPLKQVFIEVLVIETSLTNALSFGLEWGANYKFRNRFAGTTSNTAPSSAGGQTQSFTPDTTMTNLGNLVPPTAPTPQMLPSSGTGAFDLGVIGEVIRHNGKTFLTLGSLLQALQQDTETNVVDTPKILTQDGRTSTIFVGRNIPFVGSFVSNTTSSTIQSTNIEYRDIGLNLTITPVLGNSDIITLDITLDRSQTLTNVTNATLTPGTTANGIVTSKTTMDTTVHVPDNNFLILSGAVLNSNAKYKTGLPCLGGLPLIGAAFSQNNDIVSNTNIVVFIRPHIINSIDDMRSITHNQEEFFRDQAGTPFLERSFDNGMEMIKTADDE